MADLLLLLVCYLALLIMKFNVCRFSVNCTTEMIQSKHVSAKDNCNITYLCSFFALVPLVGSGFIWFKNQICLVFETNVFSF